MEDRTLPLSPDIPFAVQRALRTLAGWAGEDQFNNAQTSQTLQQLPQMQQTLSNIAQKLQNQGQTVILTFPGGFTDPSGKTFHRLHYVAGQLLRYD